MWRFVQYLGVSQDVLNLILERLNRFLNNRYDGAITTYNPENHQTPERRCDPHEYRRGEVANEPNKNDRELPQSEGRHRLIDPQYDVSLEVRER
jgi:hypothetical protein